MKTVGLFEQDTHIYYTDTNFVVLENPYNGGRPIIVMRHPGIPDMTVVYDILERVNMVLIGEPIIREDNLWYQEVKEVKYE